MRNLVIMLIALCLVVCRKNSPIEEFVKKSEKKSQENAVPCKVGKTDWELLHIPSEQITSISELNKLVGSPDTSYSEIAVYPCTSFVYTCSNRFISFHFDKDNKFLGRSFGEIIDGKFVASGTGIDL